MLSFFRSKSSEASVDKIVNGTKNIALEVDETPIDAANMQPISNDNQNNDASLQSLGYQNETELRETIYGKFVKGCCCELRFFFFNLIKIKSVLIMCISHVADILRTIRDPEKPSTLEDLKVVYEEGIFVQPPTSDDVQVVIK